ncbi:MAG: secreted protein [Chthonomonadales bacterium]|nr:secreted protein [Chthonomonadales bacterium]
MRLLLFLLSSLLISVCGGAVPAQANQGPQAARYTETARRYGLDPTSSLDSRVQDTSATVLKMFEEAGVARPSSHLLTEGERLQLSAAFAALPPLHRQILSERLRSVNFLEGMPNTALTSTVNPNESVRLFDITIRASIFRQNVSEWLTEKERSCFDAQGSPLSVSIEAGQRDAIVYVLLHEATHVVDGVLGITPPFSPSQEPPTETASTAFTSGIWSDRTTPASLYRDSLRERIHYYSGKTLPIDQANEVYASLHRTPFASLYGATNWSDDLAEYVALYHWTAVFKQPYRIVIRKEGKEVFVYEPMKSNLVRSRIAQMKPFYEKRPLTKRPEK